MSNTTRFKGIIPWFAVNPVAANLLMLLVILAGLFSMGSLRKEAFPALDPEHVTVSVSYQSGSAVQSEEGLAIKIEDALEDVTGIKTVTSSSTANGVTVTIERRSGYDLDTLLTDVKVKVDAISDLPTDAKKPVIEKARREAEAIWLQLHGDADRQTLQQLAQALRSDLLADNNISSVSYRGWLDPMMSIEIDEARLQALGLSLSDVETAINQSSSSTTTAILRHERLYLQLKTSQQAYFKQQFAAIPLKTTTDGRRVQLGEVAVIRDTFDDNSAVLSRFNGHASVALEVLSTGLDDVTTTVTSTQRVIAEWVDGGRLPSGVEISAWRNASENISGRLSLLVSNAITGIALVFLLLALFLNLRVAFWVAMGLPFIFFGALFFMGESYAGLSLNEFTTFGFIMALGIVVDDAVVVGESIYTTRAREGDTMASTIRGTLRVAVPTLFGVFTTVAAFAALSQLSGMLGQVYAQFAIVVTICLLLSVVESKLILPSHLAHLDTHRRKPSRNPLPRLWQALQNGADAGLYFFSRRIYRPLIGVALTHRYAVVVAAVALLVLVVAMPFNGTVRVSFFPDVPGDNVRGEVTMLDDASYGQTHLALTHLERRARATDQALLDEHGATAMQTGIANLQVLAEADRSGQVTIELRGDAPYDINTFTRRWRESAGWPEGVRTLSIQSAPRMVDALRIELRASDDEVLSRAGEQVRARLEALPAVSGISDNLSPGQPQLLIELTDQGRALGMTTDRLASQLYQAFNGQVVQRYQRNSDEIEVRVRYPEAERRGAANVLNARVRTPDGAVVPVSSVATVTQGFTRDTITRIDGKRAAYLSADVDKDQQSVTELVENLRTTLARELQREYPGLDIHFGGEAEQQAETASSMVSLFLLAMLVIYLLLAIPLKSYIQPVLIMCAIPFGVVGAILGHWMNDIALSILSLNGIIALSGVVVNDSLLLVSRYNEIRHKAASRVEAVTEACTSRLRAVLLTSVTTFAGLAPLLTETSFQAQFLIPAAISLGYGILFATVVTLILIPALVMIQEDIAGWCKRAVLRPRAVPEQP